SAGFVEAGVMSPTMRKLRLARALSMLLASSLISPCVASGETTVRELPLDVRIELPKVTYALGESITFAVTANRDCYFLVFTIDPDGKVEVHDPVVSGAYMGHPLLK